MPPLTRPFQRESLELLGWAGRVRELERPVERYPRLMFATVLDFGAAQAVSPLLREFASFCREKLSLDGARAAPAPRPQRRRWSRARGIYVSRAIAPRRRLANEPELIDALDSIGIESVRLESLNVQEQAAVFSEAKLVLGVHGAGLTNTIFCSPDTPVIEILPEQPVFASAFAAMTSILELPYGYLVASPMGKGQQPDPKQSDLEVDPEAVLGAVRSVLD